MLNTIRTGSSAVDVCAGLMGPFQGGQRLHGSPDWHERLFRDACVDPVHEQHGAPIGFGSHGYVTRRRKLLTCTSVQHRCCERPDGSPWEPSCETVQKLSMQRAAPTGLERCIARTVSFLQSTTRALGVAQFHHTRFAIAMSARGRSFSHGVNSAHRAHVVVGAKRKRPLAAHGGTYRRELRPK